MPNKAILYMELLMSSTNTGYAPVEAAVLVVAV